MDPVELTRALIRVPSVTPADGACLEILSQALDGFRCVRVDRGGVANLAAVRGAGPMLAFNGHVDVVPPGEGWDRPPFAAEVADGWLWGRGAVDMKSGVAAWVSAALASDQPMAILITGDEEGPAVDGTRALLDWDGLPPLTAAIVGEPSAAAQVGDRLRVGRRGSLSARVMAVGRQGHVAYPDNALNPLPALVRLLDRLASAPLDSGTAAFPPSTLAVTGIDTGNPASNVIPGAAEAALNIRFNDRHSGAGLESWVRSEAAAVAEAFGLALEVTTSLGAEPFLSQGPAVEAVVDAVSAATGLAPERSTGGGTSDARFLRRCCPVVELGLVSRHLHAVNERVPIAEIDALARLYRTVIPRLAA